MTDNKKGYDDDSERFILPDGEVLTRDQMEAALKAKVSSSRQSGERAEAQLELAKFCLSTAKPLQAYRILDTILSSWQDPELLTSAKRLHELIRGGRKTPPSERAREQHVDLLLRLGKAFSDNRLTAEDYFQKAASLTRLEDKKAESVLCLGRLHEKHGSYEGAARCYSQAFALPQGSTETWYWLNNNLGFSLARLERYTEAEAHCRRAIAIDPYKANAHKNLGLSLREQGRFLDAATSFIVASLSCPGDSRAMSHLGEMLADHQELRQGIFDTLRNRLEAQGQTPKRELSRKSRTTN